MLHCSKISRSKRLSVKKCFEIHICHHSDNVERFNYLKTKFFGYDYFFETSHHPSQIINIGESFFWNNVIWWNSVKSSLFRKFHLINIFHVPNDSISKLYSIFNYVFNRNTFEQQTRLGQLSLILKHDQAIKRFLKSSYDYALIVEDDAIIPEGALDNLNSMVAELEFTNFSKMPFYLDVGEGAKMRLSWIPFLNVRLMNNFYKMRIKACRTTCAYIINREFAKKWVTEFDNSLFPRDFIGSDFLMSGFLSHFKINVLWASPSYILHGSENGSWTSNFSVHSK
jgi:hypothetical protein